MHKTRDLDNVTFEYLYIHLPFCDVICHYCDFYTARSKEARHEDFFNALHLELTAYKKNIAPKIKTIYFGGGTPSVSPPHLLRNFLKELAPLITKETEITLEVNPNNVTSNIIAEWADAGINRLSIGVQSLNDILLKKLGRTHTANQAKSALRMCLTLIPNVSADLIYAVPEQAEEEPAQDADELLQLGLKHLSAYNLTLDNKHFLYHKIPSGDFAYQQIEKLASITKKYGLNHYEISNFALPEYESKHNKNYWHGGPYLALGPSAHGYNGQNKRWHNISDWEKYIQSLNQGTAIVKEEAPLSSAQLKTERIFTQLRLETGLNLASYRENFQEDLAIKHVTFLSELEKKGLGSIVNGHLRLSFKGRMLGDEIARKLL